MRTTLILVLTVATGCAVANVDDHIGYDVPPLAQLDSLLGDVPSEIPSVAYNLNLPARHDALRQLMSPVKSQGRRNVCSIFATVGLMEHLYIAAGEPSPDFSEQYLQWSSKFELNSRPDHPGSTAEDNLKAIAEFGIVSESVWPYESDPWDGSNDPACEGQDQPTRCYTNGQPAEQVRSATKFHLPAASFINAQDIKGHIVSEGTAVHASFQFFFQSWNHPASSLPTSIDNWHSGYVLYPNSTDVLISFFKGAGHAILIFGWDDELELPIVDKDGNAVLGDDGQPVVEKGFYLFKNSWGTNSFGVDNDQGPGYGYISTRYIHEFAVVNVASSPDSVPVDEGPVAECRVVTQNCGGEFAGCCGGLSCSAVLGPGTQQICCRNQGDTYVYSYLECCSLNGSDGTCD